MARPVVLAATLALTAAAGAGAAALDILPVPDEDKQRAARLSDQPTTPRPGDPGYRDLAHEALAREAARIQSEVPHPPGATDAFDWSATPRDRRDMSAITSTSDVRYIVEYRASCLWYRYWLRADQQGATSAASDAVTVLRQLATWPTFRSGDSHAVHSALARAAARGDSVPVLRHVELNCEGVGS